MKPSFTSNGGYPVNIAFTKKSLQFLRVFSLILLSLGLSIISNAQATFKLKENIAITTVNLDDYINSVEQAKWERIDDNSLIQPTSADFLNTSNTFIIDHQLPMAQIDIYCNNGQMTASLELSAFAKALNFHSTNGVNFNRFIIEGNLNYNTNVNLGGSSNINRLIIHTASALYIGSGCVISINELLEHEGDLEMIGGEIVIKTGAQFTYGAGKLKFLHPSAHITGEGTASFSSYNPGGIIVKEISFTNPNGMANGAGNHFQFDNPANIQLPGVNNYGQYAFLGGYGNAVTGPLMPTHIFRLITALPNSGNTLTLTNDLISETLTLYHSLVLGVRNFTLIDKDILNIYPFGSSMIPLSDERMIVTNSTGSLIITNFTGEAVFPIAHSTNLGSNYCPVKINNTGPAETFYVRAQDGVQFPYDNIHYKSATVTWFINEGTAGGTTANITFQWWQGEEESGFDVVGMKAAHYDGINVNLINGTEQIDPDNLSRLLLTDAVSSFSPWSILSPFTILPIKLISFDAILINKEESKLLWSTATENNNDRFEIERSIDGNNFVSIGQVKGKGNSSIETDYTFIDNVKGLSGVIYYRLKQIDVNGKATLSPIRNIKINNDKNSIKIGPNPFIDQVKINMYNNNIDGQVNVKIINSNGNIILDRKFNAKKGDNEFKINGLNNLASGIYIVKVISADGSISGVYQLIK